MKKTRVICLSFFILWGAVHAGPKVTSDYLQSKPYTTLSKYSNLEDFLNNPALLQRSSEFPTQIVRTQGKLHGSVLTCDQVQELINNFFTSKIRSDQFFYDTLTFCGYDPDTGFATQFLINSYFDPLTDNAITELRNYRAEHNGKELLGQIFEVEDAKGLIVSLNLNAGIKRHSDEQALLRLHADTNNYYYQSNYALLHDLLKDIHARFFTNDPSLAIPFYQQWFFPHPEHFYAALLRQSNYIELTPERIFLMKNPSKIFTSIFKHAFAHSCAKYPNKHCI